MLGPQGSSRVHESNTRIIVGNLLFTPNSRHLDQYFGIVSLDSHTESCQQYLIKVVSAVVYVNVLWIMVSWFKNSWASEPRDRMLHHKWLQSPRDQMLHHKKWNRIYCCSTRQFLCLVKLSLLFEMLLLHISELSWTHCQDPMGVPWTSQIWGLFQIWGQQLLYQVYRQTENQLFCVCD